MSPSHVIAACFALVSFAAAAMVGAVAGNSATTVLGRALIIMILCWLIGRVIGAVAEQVVDRHIERYKQEHPVPEAERAPAAASETEPDTATGQPAESEPAAQRRSAA